MEHRKLTKEDIDKVRDIEGFPIGRDEDIIALSNAPYYTACPNPFIEEFIEENGTPYDEATDDYSREPFAADVSEGKNGNIYNVHAYHTKVPYKAIVRYILHYTNPGDIVFDGFCGTGMTGVAAQLCGSDNPELLDLKSVVGETYWGCRNAIVSDLSPIATLISAAFSSVINVEQFKANAQDILDKCDKEYGWMFKTRHENNWQETFIPDSDLGDIEYTAWSDVFICPFCGEKFVFWDVATDKKSGKVEDSFKCPHCNLILKKRDCNKSLKNIYLPYSKKIASIPEQRPILIKYKYRGKSYIKAPDAFDLDIISKIEAMDIPYWYPTNEIKVGDKTIEAIRNGLTTVNLMFYKRTLAYLAKMHDEIIKFDEPIYKIWFTSQIVNISKMNRFRPTVSFPYNPLNGTIYISSLVNEANVKKAYEGKIKKICAGLAYNKPQHVIVSTNSATNNVIPENSIDYIFTDPPFGSNIMYSELNFLWESWIKVKTNDINEAIINNTQKKGLPEYSALMFESFEQFFRILKPGRWITVEFHNSKNSIWNTIQENLLRAGFVVADVRTLNKEQGSFNQVTAIGAVKQDLVISAYKPKESFRRDFKLHAGTEGTAWAFIRQHLANIPIVVVKNNKIELIAERQAYLLFDRMVAYHIMQGLPIPMDATDFYRGLDEKFLKRDGMYFLSNQVNEYDTARIKMDVEDLQLCLFVSNEKDAVAWLYQQLSDEFGGPKTYAELQPMFMQEVKSIDRYEKMPELSVLLDENFIQDDRGIWYVPDRTKEGDIAKLREKNLWKEFEGYMNSKEKLKLFRSEAIRVGFSRLWKEKNYSAIVAVAERLPEQTIQEDSNLLMYYDISLSRV